MEIRWGVPAGETSDAGLWLESAQGWQDLSFVREAWCALEAFADLNQDGACGVSESYGGRLEPPR